jgi:hypothetical protein
VAGGGAWQEGERGFLRPIGVRMRMRISLDPVLVVLGRRDASLGGGGEAELRHRVLRLRGAGRNRAVRRQNLWHAD